MKRSRKAPVSQDSQTSLLHMRYEGSKAEQNEHLGLGPRDREVQDTAAVSKRLERLRHGRVKRSFVARLWKDLESVVYIDFEKRVACCWHCLVERARMVRTRLKVVGDAAPTSACGFSFSAADAPRGTSKRIASRLEIRLYHMVWMGFASIPKYSSPCCFKPPLPRRHSHLSWLSCSLLSRELRRLLLACWLMRRASWRFSLSWYQSTGDETPSSYSS